MEAVQAVQEAAAQAGIAPFELILSILSLLGGLALFLYGMNLMSAGLERRAGNQLKTILYKLSSSPLRGLILGLAVTAVIQSSSATTVMVVGFVNSGLMKLAQSVGIIIGANIGTAATSWILSLAGIESSVWYIQLFKPSTFTPVVALIGIIMHMMGKKAKTKDTGTIFLGFAVLMFGMEMMSDSVDPITELPGFQSVLTAFSNPILGVIVGTVFTAIVQSSSASVGVLQALSVSGAISFGTAIPIIMGQNIGTCVTAMISSTGASTDARRASMIHLLFNVIGMLVWLGLFYLINAFVNFAFLTTAINPMGIALVHSIFKLLTTALLMPFHNKLVVLSTLLIKDKGKDPEKELLDERLFVTPPIALARARSVTNTMAEVSANAIVNAISLISAYDEKLVESVEKDEGRADKFEDMLGTYLVKLAETSLSSEDSHEQSKLLHMIGDFERISDHANDIAKAGLEMAEKKLVFSEGALNELKVMTSAVTETVRLAVDAFLNDNIESAMQVEPLEQVVDKLQKQIRTRHIDRLSRGLCSIEQGFVLSDILTALERVSDHCSNIAGCVIEIRQNSMDMHSYLGEIRSGENKYFNDHYKTFSAKFMLPEKMA
ncbi:MAG: Na/Pi cotransporter family protein [Clostridia bacterium]|nr:Na/Pi cotransporter family protein [Clostridia bacterium]